MIEIPLDSIPAADIDTPVMDEQEVLAAKLTLQEIIERSIEGEKGRIAGHRDMTYTMTARAIVSWDDKREIEDTVFRGFSDVEGLTRTIQLDRTLRKFKRSGDQWVLDPEAEEDEDSSVEIESDGYSDFSELPFFLEEAHEYSFELLARTLENDRVIFKIGFEPKSEFKGLPSGIVYVDTSRYKIIHEQFHFAKNPFPLFLKNVSRISRHWEELPGGEWVFTKIMMRVELRSDPFGLIPEKVAIALIRDDFQFDQGYDEKLFGER